MATDIICVIAFVFFLLFVNYLWNRKLMKDYEKIKKEQDEISKAIEKISLSKETTIKL